MRLVAIDVRDVAPVRRFAADDLSDVVVVAGPNGVGKSRLLGALILRLRSGGVDPAFRATVEATRNEELEAWDGKDVLDLASAEDMALFTSTLQGERLRGKWRSSLLNIDSQRSIAQLRPLAPSWEYANPGEELVSWDQTMGSMSDRYQDTVHSMFRMIQAQDHGISSRARQLRREGRPSMNLDFEEPMEPFKEVFALLLAPKQLADPVPSRGHLEYVLEGETRPFSSLSSGETEVVNVAFDFLLRNPEDCIVFFDEPELHLHPELSYRLLQTLRTIGKSNQFILSTHSPDVITSSLQHSVLFLSASDPGDDGAEPANQAIPVSESDETHQALTLLGQSIGIVALGKRIVLIEGLDSSLDKQVYGAITRERWPGLVLVPSGGKHVIQSFAAVYDAVLSQSIWGVDFFMLTDGDSFPSAADETQTAQDVGRLRRLPRYHIENYFLDEHVWSEAFQNLEDDGSWMRSPARVREEIRSQARALVPYSTALAASSYFRLRVGNLDIMARGVQDANLDQLQSLLAAKVDEERLRIREALDQDQVSQWVDQYHSTLVSALDEDSDEWLALIPGKPLLAGFASRCGLRHARAKTLYLAHALASEREPFADVYEIFEHFSSM